MPSSPEQRPERTASFQLETPVREGDYIHSPPESRRSSDVRALVKMLSGEFLLPPASPAPQGLLPDEIDEWFKDQPEKASQWKRDYETWERLFDFYAEGQKT